MPIAINGTGTMTGLTAPIFSAYQTAASSITTGVFSKVALQTEEVDSSSAFDNVTNFRFQPPLAGYYQINGSVSAGTNPGVIAAIYKNGTEHRRGSHASLSVSCVSSLVYFNGTTDYVELWCYNSAATQNTLAGINFTYFNGFFVRA